MNSRRLMAHPRAKTFEQTQTITFENIRSVLRHSKIGWSMSEMGQERPIRGIRVVSASPPTATKSLRHNN